jgi:hypothetical protein
MMREITECVHDYSGNENAEIGQEMISKGSYAPQNLWLLQHYRMLWQWTPSPNASSKWYAWEMGEAERQ